jgi:hypothetical protein
LAYKSEKPSPREVSEVQDDDYFDYDDAMLPPIGVPVSGAAIMLGSQRARGRPRYRLREG